MALNVSFLKGTQDNLNKLSAYQAGSFYLTTDTDRLYFAQANDKLVYLNKYITTVAAQSGLPNINNVNVGDFYYVANDNILCTKAKAGDSKYTQINPPDTNTDTQVSSLDFVSAAKDNNIEVSYTLVQSTYDKISGDKITSPTDITGTFTIKGSDIGAVVTNISLDVDASVSNNIATVELDGTGVASDADGIKIKGGTNVTISSDATADIVISAADTTYDLASPANSTDIVLTDHPNGDEDTVSIVKGGNNNSITVTGAEANKITIAHKDYTYSKEALAAQTVGNGGSFDIVSGVTLENGHVTGVNTSKVNLPEISYKISAVNADNAGKIYVTLADVNGDGEAVASGQSLFYKIDGAQVYNQAELTDYFYLKSEIDDTLKSANAMTFKGSVGTGGSAGTALPTTGVKAGDTYLVVGDAVISAGSAKGTKGDMFIATGTETNGVLTNISWIHVPSGDEIDTTYEFSFSAGEGLKIKNNVTTDSITLAISGGTAIDVTTDGSLNIKHADVPRNDGSVAAGGTLSPNKEINIVTAVESNAQGHVTKVTTTKYAMPAAVTYELEHEDENHVVLVDANDDVQGTIGVIAGDHIVVTGVDNGKGTDFTVKHATATVGADTVIKTPLNAKDTINVITKITDDGHGHVKSIGVTEFTLPDDSTYTYAGTNAVANNKATVVTTLSDKNGDPVGSHTFAMKSESLNIALDKSEVKVELQWGSFDIA